MTKIFIQIGAGAGDQDSRAEFRDGFSEYVKRQAINSEDRIILVEPNPLNLLALKKCWQAYPQASVHQIGIVPKEQANQSLIFYYASEDAPHFQVGSFNAAHVLKHYPKFSLSDLETIEINTVDLRTFIEATAGNCLINLLCLDIEGIDADVWLDTDLKSLNVDFISFEHLHLGPLSEAVIAHFECSGYRKIGDGIDHNGFDWLYQKNPKD